MFRKATLYYMAAARSIPASPELTRRLKAAQAYGGYSEVGEMAEAVGIGRTTLFHVLGGRRDLKEMEARQIAVVTGLPFDFFSADFSSGEQPPMPPE